MHCSRREQASLIHIFSRAYLDAVLVAQTSPAARPHHFGLDSRGETPPEPAGEDARAAIFKNGVKMRVFFTRQSNAP